MQKGSTLPFQHQFYLKNIHPIQAIIKILGEERRNRVLAGLYMGRSDVAILVRQAALHVWKVVVTNTPKTLREILPTLFSLLLGHLASTSYDKRQVNKQYSNPSTFHSSTALLYLIWYMFSLMTIHLTFFSFLGSSCIHQL